ncbi:Outer membrane cobalamin translocator [Bacteroidales bacterium Barb6XT]|nr:Outer membrane cobalamin translocator [Bacteroidales bacterium Barb6XT]
MPCFIVRKMLCLCAWLISVSLLYAQEGDTLVYRTLSEVEVVEKARPSVTAQTMPLQQLGRAEIERLGLQSLSEAVKRFSGVTVKDYGGIGGLKTVSIRGLGAQHTAVSYDGITVSDAQSGQADISRFSLDDVESVSLSVGQTDDIFRTARMYASAGALMIKTSAPDFEERPYRLRAQVRAGSFGLVNPYLRYDRKLSKGWAASLQGDYLRADGDYLFTLTNGSLTEKKKRLNSDIETRRAEVNLLGHLGKGGNLSIKGYYFDSERGLPGSVILYNDYAGERLWDRNGFLQAHYEKRFNSRLAVQAQGKYNYAWNRYVDINNNYASGKQEDRYTQREYYSSASILYSPADRISFSLTEDFFVNTLDNTLPNCPFPTRYTALTVAAAQYKDTRLTATASLLSTFITEQVKEGTPPTDRKRLSPALSASWRIFPDRNLRLRAAFKDIFRTPTFNDLYYIRVGNTNLKPERARQYNAGITWNGALSAVIPYVSLTVDGYYNRVHDKIVATPTLFIWKMRNAGEVSIKGVDIHFSAQTALHEKITLQWQGTYTYQQAIDLTDETAKNYRHQIPYTPRHTGSASLSAQSPWLNISYSLTAVGDRYALPQNTESNRINRYTEQSISLSRDFPLKACRLRLQGEIINPANVNYDIIKFYPMPGRSWRINLSIIL